MTVAYHSNLSSVGAHSWIFLLLRWKASVYKVIGVEFIVYFGLYAIISLVYRCALNADQRSVFELLVLMANGYVDNTQVVLFVLGFYVATVVHRWWKQLQCIPWPDSALTQLTTLVSGSFEHMKALRHTVARYLLAAFILRVRDMGAGGRKRFLQLKDLVEEGYLSEEELVMYNAVSSEFSKHWIPCQWICKLLAEARRVNLIKSDYVLQNLTKEVNKYAYSLRWLYLHDKVSIPLVYTQVVTLAVYTYFATMLLGRQYLDSSKNYAQNEIDLYIPLFTMCQFVFFVGWLKVAEALMNPFGEDDDDFEIGWFIDRHTEVARLIVDEHWTLCDQLPLAQQFIAKREVLANSYLKVPFLHRSELLYHPKLPKTIRTYSSVRTKSGTTSIVGEQSQKPSRKTSINTM